MKAEQIAVRWRCQAQNAEQHENVLSWTASQSLKMDLAMTPDPADSIQGIIPIVHSWTQSQVLNVTQR